MRPAPPPPRQTPQVLWPKAPELGKTMLCDQECNQLMCCACVPSLPESPGKINHHAAAQDSSRSPLSPRPPGCSLLLPCCPVTFKLGRLPSWSPVLLLLTALQRSPPTPTMLEAALMLLAGSP
jgi:hypothetical protein